VKFALSQLERERGSRHRRVARSAEFRRIEKLPRRDWQGERSRLGLLLAKPSGTMSLWPIQEAALRECMQLQGLFGAIAVGKGKALVSLLAPVVMNAKRPLLLVPANLRDQTNRKVLPEMAPHWELHPNLRVLAYSELSLAKNASILFDIAPDVIIADEASALKNPKSGRTRRVTRYMAANPDTRFVALDGTFSRNSLRDCAHILVWCLRSGAPLPRNWRELNMWADALDDGVADADRIDVGALERFNYDDPRAGFLARFNSTRGVIVSGADELAAGLRILERPLVSPPIINEKLNLMREMWETPDGWPIVEAVAMWRHVREVAAGFYYRWDPRPPPAWIRAYKAWAQYVGHTLAHNRRGLDTPLQVWNDAAQAHKRPVAPRAPALEDTNGLPLPNAAVRREVHARKMARHEIAVAAWRKALDPEHCAFCLWSHYKGTFKPNSVPVWIDDFLVADAIKWLDEGPGIAWVEHRAVGERIAALSGHRYYGAGADSIVDATGPIVASVAAHGKGKNLQHYSRNLFTSAMTSGATVEQVLGRTHRHGQRADFVSAEVYQHEKELRDGFAKAFGNAKWLQETRGMRQKLLYADLGASFLAYR